MSKITADAETLMQQASMTAQVYFNAAIKLIDDQFGEGYAQGHPELLGAFMQTAARDYQTSCTVQAMQQLTEAIDAHVGTIAR